MHTFDLSDIMFFIKSYKSPHPGFNITDYISHICYWKYSTRHSSLIDLNQVLRQYYQKLLFQQIAKNLESYPSY